MEPEAPSATPVAPKFDKTSVMTNGKFDDRKLARVKLPTREQQQFYASELMEDGLSLRVVIGYGGTIKLSAATYNERGKDRGKPGVRFRLTVCSLRCGQSSPGKPISCTTRGGRQSPTR